MNEFGVDCAHHFVNAQKVAAWNVDRVRPEGPELLQPRVERIRVALG
jgi:hypothetical protein